MFSPPARGETAKSRMVPGKEGCPLNVPADQVGVCGRARLPFLGLIGEGIQFGIYYGELWGLF